MSTRPAAKNRSRLLAAFLSGAKRFSSTLSDQAAIDAGVGLLIIVALSILLMRNYQRPAIEPLPVGATATEDIIAPKDLKTEDTDQTNLLRAQAAQQVLPVFDYNPRITREVLQSIEKMFAVGRSAPADTPSDQLGLQIESESGVFLDTDQLDTLRKHQFDTELEKLMSDQVELILISGVVARRSQLVKFGANGITRRDTRNKEETVINNISSVYDRMTARAALRSEKLTFPPDYTPAERKLLGEIMGLLVASNLEYDEAETEARKESARKGIAPIMVPVERGKPIVVAG
ncbi:MAG: hypothetical protein AB1631_26015, partial [Acidobacteriota bacterium]